MAIPPYLKKEHARLTPKNFTTAAARTNKWFEIKNVADSTAEIFIYDEVGGWGILAADFVRELQAIDAETLNVRISSPGGSVFEALAIYASLRSFQATVNVIVDGLCASAATVIAMAGDSIKTAPGSMWMVHDPWGTVMGNAQDMQAMADLLDKTGQNIADIYAARAGGDAETWRTTMKAETWYSSDETVAAGLADGLTESAKEQVAARTPVVVNATTEQTPVHSAAPVFDIRQFRDALKEAIK